MVQSHVNELVAAAINNNMPRIIAMLEITPQIINDKTSGDGCTALFWASRLGHDAIVNLLLDKGADPNIQNMTRNTALVWAVKDGHESIVKLLLVKGAKPNIQNKNLATALMEASSNGHLSIAEILLNNGADPNVESRFGHTALTNAGHNVSMVKLLLCKGANPNLQNKNGVTALMEASGKGYISVAEILLNNGAHPNVQSNVGDTPLTMAGHNESMVRLLLCKRADPNFQNKFGVTALMKAISQGYASIARLLLSQRADPNRQDENGYTALVIASSRGETSQVELLLEYGADVRIENNNGATAYDLARNEETRRVMRLFLLRQSLNTQRLHVIQWNDIIIIDRISSSNFSCVYRGVYRDTDVAIKMLHGDSADLQHREIEILSNLHHPRIVSLLGVILDIPEAYDSIFGLVTEFMPRGSLYDVLHLDTTPPEHRLISLSSKLRVLRDVADGMRFLHMSNVIHRDLKSSNVLLDGDGRAKICDFGMSQCATDATGTTAWSSPESLCDDAGALRQSSDVYSFGVILWEMLSNSVPWDGLTPFQIAARVSYGESLPFEVAAAYSDVAPELHTLLESCLKTNPDERPTFGIILQYIKTVLEQSDEIWFVQCAQSGDIAEAEKLLLGAPRVFNARDKDGNTALMLACKHGNVDMVRFLLERAADINLQNKIGGTALRLARDPPVLAVLVDWFRSRLTSKPSYSYWSNLINPSIYLDPPYNSIMRDSEAHAVLDVMFDSLSYRAAQDEASTCRLHLCGEGLSGKSCLYAHLRSVLSGSSDVSDKKQSSKNTSDCLHDGMDDNDIDAWMRGKNRVEVDPGDPGRTKGIRISTVRSMKHNGTQFIIYDYGGQREFLINHGSFLSAPGSVYVIVLPLWNKKENKKYEDDDIVSRYSFWLRFIHSASRKNVEEFSCPASIPILTIINRFDNNSGYCMCGRTEDDINTLINDLKKTCSHFHQHFAPVSLFGVSTTLTDRDVLQVNCNARDGAEQVSDALCHALEYLKQPPRTMYPVARLIRNDIDATTDWNLVMTHDEWMQRAIQIIIASYPKLNTLQNHELKSYLLNMLAREALESLLHSGAMLQISSHNQTCYATSPNELTNKVLGAMLYEMAKPLHSCGGASDAIASMLKERQNIFNNIVMQLNLQKSVTIDILRSVGLAVPLSQLPRDSDVSQGMLTSDMNDFYYVVHGLLSEDMPNEWFRPFSGATRILTRTFMLANKDADMFYPGYFAALFRQVISLESTSTVNIWRNGMDVQAPKIGCKVQINISPAGYIEDGFHVMVATNEEYVNDQYDYAFETMKKIRNIVFNLSGVSVIEYCGRYPAYYVEMSMIAFDDTDNRFYHELYCGQYPSQHLVNTITALLNQHGQEILREYKESVATIISNANANPHVLDDLLRKLFKQSDQNNQLSEERMIVIVENLLKDRSEQDRKILSNMVQANTQITLDAVHDLSKTVAELQENMRHGLSDLLNDIIAQNNILLDKMLGDSRNSILSRIDELHQQIRDSSEQNFEATKLHMSQTVRGMMSELQTLRAQMQDSDDDELRSLQKLQNRLEGIEQSMQRVLTAEDAEKMLKNTVVTHLRDDVSTMFYSFMGESNECMQDIAGKLLTSIDTKLQSVETKLHRQGADNAAHTEQAIENLRTLLEKVDSVQSDLTATLIYEPPKKRLKDTEDNRNDETANRTSESVAQSLKEIVAEHLEHYILPNDTRYDQIHAMLMEHGRALQAIRTMQENVIYSATDMPLLWCVSVIKENMFNIEYHIQCVCSVCGKKVRGGLTEKKQRKMGYYELKVSKRWASPALKRLKITLKVLEIIGRAFSLPVPAVSSFIDDMNAFGVSEEQIQQMASALEAAESLNDRISVVNNTISNVMNAAGLSAVLQENSGEVTVPSTPQSISLLYVAEIRNLLKVLGVDLPPRYCGLRPVKHSRDGSLVWLCEKSCDETPDACMKKFEDFGKDGLIYYPVFE